MPDPIDPFDLAFGTRVKELRNKWKLTQVVLGKMTGLTHQAIYTIEKGIRGISGRNVHALCIALRTTPNYLLFGREDLRHITHPELYSEDNPKDEVLVNAEAMMREVTEHMREFVSKTKTRKEDTDTAVSTAEEE